jgi:predicted nucleic acid-binding protein
MIVVADAGPLHYLVVIGAVDVLGPLYNRVVLPEAVAQELRYQRAPESVRAWISSLPRWAEIRPDPHPDPSVEFLDPGERAAISLAVSLNADRVLIDEWDGRVEAERRNLTVTGTLGVLAEAHLCRLLDFEGVLGRLRQTNFYASDDLIKQVRQTLAEKAAT